MQANSTDEKFSIRRLLRAESFSHDVRELQLLETHISWVVLTGPFAYKIKKPVKFAFVDYTALAFRKRFCDLEIELNRRFAPELYLGVVPIYEIAGQLIVGTDCADANDNSPPLEYAVKMLQFPQTAIVASRLQHPELTTEAVAQFGRFLAEFHSSINAADSLFEMVQVEKISNEAADNFLTLRDAFVNDDRAQRLERLKQWTINQSKKLTPKFQQRLDGGMVRRCHGDLHLKNIIQMEGRLIAFDGIEFNEKFQWIDTLSELAFPVMDFLARGRSDLGWRLLNSYLATTGEYEALDVLRFYLVYRAMVRAKVGWLNPLNRAASNSDAIAGPGNDPFFGPWDKYLAVASSVAFDLNPSLSITHGFSGSGKSTLAMEIVEREGGILIRTDVERNRLFAMFKTNAKYSTEMNTWTYAHAHELATLAIEAGFPVIVDATYLKHEQRQSAERLARKLRVDFKIIDCDAPYEELCGRIRERRGDASEATIDVLKIQMRHHDPLTAEELVSVKAGL